MSMPQFLKKMEKEHSAGVRCNKITTELTNLEEMKLPATILQGGLLSPNSIIEQKKQKYGNS